MLSIDNITKRFGERTAVDGLSLEVDEGEIFGLLGPNGAGKSTTIHMAVGLLQPSAGSIDINGAGRPDDPRVRMFVGVATQALALYEDLTGRENLRFFGRLYELARPALAKRVDEAAEFVGLADRLDDRVGTYSGGMKRRLNLAAALLHEPRLLLLDEPTVGVDPQSRNAILDQVAELKATGRTVVYTSHYMEEVERVCDRVAIIDHGKLLALGTVDDLIAEHGGPLSVTWTNTNGEHREVADDAAHVVTILQGAGAVRRVQVETPNLETVFLNLTGRSLRDA